MPIKNLTITLELLASSGIVLSTEQKAVLETSLPLKKIEAGLTDIKFWGKFITLNGKDYLLAKGVTELPYLFEGNVHCDEKYYYSQNGVIWLDLGPLDQITYGRAAQIGGMLTGEAGHKYIVLEPAPIPPEPEVVEGADANAEGEGVEGEATEAKEDGEEDEEVKTPEPLKHEITEAQRLRFCMENICLGTNLVPDGYFTCTAENMISPNQLFSGISYPDKLESYLHGPMGQSLSKDVTGSWAMQFDSFKALATLRSLAYPGYTFVYAADMKEFDSLYLGTGEPNKDMMFMIA
mmetsp:Transcript_5921/g.7993  ORF Transcript_5921/g.7993 Transcript_5921/m.7993 type:complete len:293 (-) Transcript_5921:130-1008(-)|eukprot:CAMPEP_0196571158 /NCGR_PEP_ID=MMETSP1081-20130531/1325_1 /TAXON_ID=36882 /ORGANISM="Pyramimonas amylifera, Strain CCMP720" /LENGTH=292 /DNA_ID=CAMNT_0041887971 /DNA_START=216 /DNA_END=1094 /DNA_ORIENTATION=-